MLRGETRIGSENGLEAAARQLTKGGEAVSEAVAGDEAAAEERAEKGAGGEVALGHIAVGAAGDEVAVGIAAETRARDDVVEYGEAAEERAQAIKTAAAVACEDGAAVFGSLKEVDGFQIFSVTRARHHAAGDFARERYLDLVALIAALADAKKALSAQASQDVAHRAARKTRADGECARGGVKDAKSLQAAAADQIRVEHAVGGGEGKGRRKMVFNVGPEEGGVGRMVARVFGFHEVPAWKQKGRPRRAAPTNASFSYCILLL